MGLGLIVIWRNVSHVLVVLTLLALSATAIAEPVERSPESSDAPVDSTAVDSTAIHEARGSSTPALRAVPVASTPEAAQASAAASPKAGGLWGPRFPGHPWELSLAFDYSRALKDSHGIQIDPYRLGLAFSAGYFWPGGLGLALVGDAYAGSALNQLYYPPLTSLELTIDAKSQLFDMGAQVSYDHPLGPVLLRYALSAYVGLMSWDFGNLPYVSLAGSSPPADNGVVLSLDPGLSVLWPIGTFFLSAKVHTRVSFSSDLPSAFGGALGIGVRL